MNWIDTAPSYGDGKSEEALGWLLKEVDAKPYLSTKVGLDLSRADLPGQIEASLEQSLKRLDRNSVDLFQLHNPIGPEPAGAHHRRAAGAGRGSGVAETFERLRDQGLFKFFGITALGRPRRASRGDRERPFRFRPGLLQPARSQCRPESAERPGPSRTTRACSAPAASMASRP